VHERDKAPKLRKEVFALGERQPNLVGRQTDGTPLETTHLDGFRLLPNPCGPQA
jgi:hypothetical protein